MAPERRDRPVRMGDAIKDLLDETEDKIRFQKILNEQAIKDNATSKESNANSGALTSAPKNGLSIS